MLPLFFSGGGVNKPELRGSSNGGFAATTTCVVTKPAGAIIGDLGFAYISWNDTTATCTPPAGWVLVAGSDITLGAPGGERASLFKYTFTGTEPASYNFTFSVATQGSYVALAYLNAQTVDVLTSSTNTVANASPVTVTFPTITPTLANETIVLFASLDPTVAGITTTWTPPTGFIQRAKQDWIGAGAGIVWAADNVKTGATGAMPATVVTSANSVGWIAYSVALTTKVASGVTGTYSGSQNQTFNANGTVSAPTITGTFTGSQQQTFSANGTAIPPLISGSFTGAQQQTFSANGTFTPQAINGTFAGSQQQTFSAAGTFTPAGVIGAYAGSQVQSFSASGTFTNPAVTGTYSGSQVQTFSASGVAVPPAITGNFTGGQTQTFSAVGGSIAPITGSFTGSQLQTFTAAGTFTPSAISGAYTGSQRQTFNAAGTAIPPAISGTYSGSQQQTFNASGGAISPVTGDYTGSQVQSFSGSGGAVVPITGTYTSGQTQTFTSIGQHGSTEQPSGSGQNAGGNTKRDETPFLITMPRPLRRAIGKKESKQSLTKNIESVIELARDKQRNDILTEVQAIEFAADALKVLLMQAQIEWESSYQLWLKHQVQLRIAGEDDECFYLMAMMA